MILGNKNNKSGFSMIEIMTGIFVFTLIGFAVYAFQKNVFSLNRIISSSLTAQDEARRALKIMSAEIRTTSPSSLGAYAIAQAVASSFTFYSDIDGDSLKERVRYFVEGAILKKGIIKPSGAPLAYNPADEIVSALIHDVANGAEPIFSYYDTYYDGTTQPLSEPVNISAIRLVKINVLIDKNAFAPPAPIAVTTQISMRNLKDNL